MYVCMYVCMYIYIYMCLCMYIYNICMYNKMTSLHCFFTIKTLRRYEIRACQASSLKGLLREPNIHVLGSEDAPPATEICHRRLPKSRDLEVSIVMGVSNNMDGLFQNFMENPNLTWMMSGNLHVRNPG